MITEKNVADMTVAELAAYSRLLTWIETECARRGLVRYLTDERRRTLLAALLEQNLGDDHAAASWLRSAIDTDPRFRPEETEPGAFSEWFRAVHGITHDEWIANSFHDARRGGVFIGADAARIVAALDDMDERVHVNAFALMLRDCDEDKPADLALWLRRVGLPRARAVGELSGAERSSPGISRVLRACSDWHVLELPAQPIQWHSPHEAAAARTIMRRLVAQLLGGEDE